VTTTLCIIAGVIIAPLWIWLIVKIKMWDIDRRNKRDSPIELHLKD
jgi:hypothetical protein